MSKVRGKGRPDLIKDMKRELKLLIRGSLSFIRSKLKLLKRWSLSFIRSKLQLHLIKSLSFIRIKSLSLILINFKLNPNKA